MVKTTRAKEEEKQKNTLDQVLHPQTKSQPLLKYHRAFKDVVEQIHYPSPSGKGLNDSLDSGGNANRSADSRSLSRSEISMYNTDNINVKHIYTTKSLIINRFQNSPYVHSPAKKKQLDKPWRVNMNHNNLNFVEQHEQNKFLTNL